MVHFTSSRVLLNLSKNKELYKDCEKLPPFTPIFFPSDPPKVATKSLPNHKIIGPLFSPDEIVKSVVKEGHTEEVVGSNPALEIPNVDPLFYSSDLVRDFLLRQNLKLYLNFANILPNN